MAEQTTCVQESAEWSVRGQEDTLYLILSSLHTHYKHELGSNQVGTQHTVNVVTHAPQSPEEKSKMHSSEDCS